LESWSRLGLIPELSSGSQVNASPPVFVDESSYQSRAFSRHYESSSQLGSFHGRYGVYTRRQSLPPAPPSDTGLCDPAAHRLFMVLEKPEGEATWETPPDITGGQSTGGSTHVCGDDITAQSTVTPQRNDNMKTDQT